jgi:nitrite reductase/ring-hydroxylating ferredoxin subunit
MPTTTASEPLVDPSFIRVASLAEIPDGELRAFESPRGRVVIAHVEQELFGLADECPADGAPLSEGTLDEAADALICPGDGIAFDLRTGEPLGAPGVDAVAVHAARVDDEGWVEIGRPSGGG